MKENTKKIQKEQMPQITVSPLVIADFESHFKAHEKQDIRIYLAPGSVSSRLALVLDHAQQDDATYETQGYRFCFTPELLEKCGGIDIDLNDMGFVLTPRIPFAARSLSCASHCGSCASKCSDFQ